MDLLSWWKGMENALDAASLRQQVIANNIANAGTPNFSAQRVAFEEELQKAVASNDDGGIGVRPVSMEEQGNNANAKGGIDMNAIHGRVENTGGKVDIHQEMANLAKNQLYYSMVTDKIGGMMKGFMGIIDQLERR